MHVTSRPLSKKPPKTTMNSRDWCSTSTARCPLRGEGAPAAALLSVHTCAHCAGAPPPTRAGKVRRQVSQ